MLRHKGQYLSPHGGCCLPLCVDSRLSCLQLHPQARHVLRCLLCLQKHGVDCSRRRLCSGAGLHTGSGLNQRHLLTCGMLAAGSALLT